MVIVDDPSLVGAIQRNELAKVASTVDEPWAADATATTARIGARVRELADEVDAELSRHGVEAGRAAAGARQRHAIEVAVADAATADRAAGLLGVLGFEPWDRWTGGAAASFRRHAGHATVARTTDVTEVVRIAWRTDEPRGRWQRLVRPTEGDWSAVTLPSRLWWLYPAVRPLRLAGERAGLRRRFAASMGPFLATSASLIDPLFEVADLGPADRVADLGCGDGRLVLAAAERYGCRGLGVDRDPALVDLGRAAAEGAGMADRVQFVVGDARDVQLDDVTVVLVFLPVDVLATVLDDVLARLPAGARVIAHEQHSLPPDLRAPDRSVAVIAPDAVTVAHRWGIDRSTDRSNPWTTRLTGWWSAVRTSRNPSADGCPPAGSRPG